MEWKISRRGEVIASILSIKRSYSTPNANPMSARGSLVSNPNKKSAKLLSESKSYIPLLWLCFLSRDDFDSDGDQSNIFIVNRKHAIERAKDRLDFLVDVFDDFRTLEDDINLFLDRLSRLKCETIGIDVSELTFSAPPIPDLKVAVDTIESRNKSFSLSIPPRTDVNPFTGDKVKLKALKITSTREMLLGVC